MVEIRKSRSMGDSDDFYLVLWIETHSGVSCALVRAQGKIFSRAQTRATLLPILTHGKLYRRALEGLKQGMKGEKRQN